MAYILSTSNNIKHVYATIFRTSVIGLCKAAEVLKAIEATFQRHALAIGSMVSHICQNLSCNIITGIARAKVCQIVRVTGHNVPTRISPPKYPHRNIPSQSVSNQNVPGRNVPCRNVPKPKIFRLGTFCPGDISVGTLCP